MAILRGSLTTSALALLLAGCATTAPEQATPPPPAAVASASTQADRMVQLDGLRLRVRIEGPADAPPVILIHGFTFSLESWDAWAADLSRDHRVIRYDLAGHGLSDADPRQGYGTRERVERLRELMDALGIERATLAGNSFGGLIAWNFAALHPDRVDKLILVDSAAYSINGVTEQPVPVPPAMRAHLLAPTPAGVAASAALIFAHPDQLTPERLAQMRETIARNGPELVAHLERFTLPEPTPTLGRIKAPTLILWGSADRIIPVDHAARLAAAIPGARTAIYQDVGHAPQEEAPDRTIADVRSFLSGKQ